jgi:colicin import membrane protein
MQMQSNEWKLPLNFAVGLHVMVLLGALFLPGLFKAKPKFADVYTVSLINIAEPVAAPPAAKAPAPAPAPAKAPAAASAPPPPPAAPPIAKKAVPVAEIPDKVEPAPAPPPTPAPVKAISLKPLKQKIVKTVKEPEPEIPPKKNEQDVKKVQKLAEALREEAIKEESQKKELIKREQAVLTERARLAQEALDQERQLLARSNRAQARMAALEGAESTIGQQSNAPAVSGSSTNLLESQYQAAIASRLQQFWSLPEHLQKDPNLLATVVITIKLEGEIANMVFESKSGDRLFDQYVSKTIEAANPLPPIPPALKKQRYEIGFRFKPGSIQ